MQKLLEVRSGLHRKLCRLDPLGLPIETVEQIFSHFDTREIWYGASVFPPPEFYFY